MLKSELGKQLYRKCQLDGRRQELELRKQSIEEQLPEAKAAKREADVALHEYRYGSLGVFFHKLSGKYEEKLENLTRKAAAADSALAALKRDLEIQKTALEEVRAQIEELGGNSDVIAQAEKLEQEERELILHKAAWITASRLSQLLEKAETALEEAQEWARPNNRIDVAPGYTKGQLLAQAEGCARECAECLRYISRCGILLEIHPYFLNPTGYIHGVAAQYAELDRINRALGGIRQTKRQTEELLLQLAEEENP